MIEFNNETGNWHEFFGVSEETYDELCSITSSLGYHMSVDMSPEINSGAELISRVTEESKKAGIDVDEKVQAVIVKLATEIFSSLKSGNDSERKKSLIMCFIQHYQREHNLPREKQKPTYKPETLDLLQGMLGPVDVHNSSNQWSEMLGVDENDYEGYVNKAYDSIRQAIGSSSGSVDGGMVFQWIMTNATTAKEVVIYSFLAGRFVEEYEKDTEDFMSRCILKPLSMSGDMLSDDSPLDNLKQALKNALLKAGLRDTDQDGSGLSAMLSQEDED